MKFLLYNLVGGLIMLAAVIGLYVVGAGTFSLQEITEARADGELTMATSTERWLFLGFFFAFAVKAPLWPLHTWLPNAMGESTAPVAVLITAVVDKVGTFAMLRFCLGLFPEASKWATPVDPRPGADQHRLRRAARGRPAGHQAADRVRVDLPLRLHRPGHLRDDLARASAARRSTWSTTASRPPR